MSNTGGLIAALLIGGVVIGAAQSTGSQEPNGNQEPNVGELVVQGVHSSRSPSTGLRHYAYCGHTVDGDEVTEVEIPESLAYGELVEGAPCPRGGEAR